MKGKSKENLTFKDEDNDEQDDEQEQGDGQMLERS